MNDLFDRPVIILETDRNKSDDGHATAHPSRNLLSPALSRTKYIDALVSQLTRSKIQMLYSDGPQASLPHGYSQIFRSYVIWPFGLLDYDFGTLHCPPSGRFAGFVNNCLRVPLACSGSREAA